MVKGLGACATMALVCVGNVYLFVPLFIYLSSCLFINSSTFCCLFIYLFIYLPISLSFYLLIYLFIHSFVQTFISYLCTYLFVQWIVHEVHVSQHRMVLAGLVWSCFNLNDNCVEVPSFCAAFFKQHRQVLFAIICAMYSLFSNLCLRLIHV